MDSIWKTTVSGLWLLKKKLSSVMCQAVLVEKALLTSGIGGRPGTRILNLQVQQLGLSEQFPPECEGSLERVD